MWKVTGPWAIALAALIPVVGAHGGAPGGRFQSAEATEHYQNGRRALERGAWEEAVTAFERAAEDALLADAALYWQAYAYERLGEPERALGLVNALETRFPDSRWRDDARALETEIRGAPAGEAASVEDEELKLMALNALMHADEERAVTILEEFLSGDHSQRLKERALFVLAQGGSEEAYEVLARVARRDTEPELQKRAIRYLGVHHSQRSLELLGELYGSLQNEDARRAVLRSFMIAGEKERLLALATEEPNEDLRGRAIRLLGTMSATEELWEIYEREGSEDVRRKILQAFMVSGDEARLLGVAKNAEESAELRKVAVRLLGAQGATAALWELYGEASSDSVKEGILHGLFVAGERKRLTEVAERETESLELREAAIHHLGAMGEEARASLVELYESEQREELKEKILHALFVQGAASELIAIARVESNAELKKKAVHWLSLIGSPEAQEFMLEILRR